MMMYKLFLITTSLVWGAQSRVTRSCQGKIVASFRAFFLNGEELEGNQLYKVEIASLSASAGAPASKNLARKRASREIKGCYEGLKEIVDVGFNPSKELPDECDGVRFNGEEPEDLFCDTVIGICDTMREEGLLGNSTEVPNVHFGETRLEFQLSGGPNCGSSSAIDFLIEFGLCEPGLLGLIDSRC